MTENINGLIRRFLPKETDFDNIKKLFKELKTGLIIDEGTWLEAAKRSF